ncbi:hypothetical protein BP5796_00313 [Coleophoma crateriformis]|uniref:Uncharacterized protein n=1 Tax=Coleophoma crateriformis TaxID=565419 RepID=A0A3D8T7P4_9HELO|nr:hypothetical protein BP5796_00313 [Coleophoma crateriformis]
MYSALLASSQISQAPRRLTRPPRSDSLQGDFGPLADVQIEVDAVTAVEMNFGIVEPNIRPTRRRSSLTASTIMINLTTRRPVQSNEGSAPLRNPFTSASPTRREHWILLRREDLHQPWHSAGQTRVRS